MNQHPAHMKRRRIILLGALLLTLALAGVSAFVIQLHRDYSSIPQDHFIGNTPASLAALKEKGLPFSFLVIGDTQCNETVEVLVERALQKWNPSFMVFLGDFVKQPDIWFHRFFLTEMAVEMKPHFPVFLVSGNHDIYYPPKKYKKTEENVAPDRRVTLKTYEALYGARSYDFVFNNCLFIICGVDRRDRTGYLNELRDTLRQKGRDKQHIFVFVHYPPKGLADYIEASLPGEDEFFSLLGGYKDVTCFFGDFHGYWRGQRNGVNLIVTGGGGRLKEFRLKASQPNWGHFNHLLRVSVDQNRVSEELLTVEMGPLLKLKDLEDAFSEMVFLKVLPLIQSRTWVLYGFFCLFSFSAFCALILFAGSFIHLGHSKAKLKEPSPVLGTGVS
jgi:hypothetical protein